MQWLSGCQGNVAMQLILGCSRGCCVVVGVFRKLLWTTLFWKQVNVKFPYKSNQKALSDRLIISRRLFKSSECDNAAWVMRNEAGRVPAVIYCLLKRSARLWKDGKRDGNLLAIKRRQSKYHYSRPAPLPLFCSAPLSADLTYCFRKTRI